MGEGLADLAFQPMSLSRCSARASRRNKTSSSMTNSITRCSSPPRALATVIVRLSRRSPVESSLGRRSMPRCADQLAPGQLNRIGNQQRFVVRIM